MTTTIRRRPEPEELAPLLTSPELFLLSLLSHGPLPMTDAVTGYPTPTERQLVRLGLAVRCRGVGDGCWLRATEAGVAFVGR